MINVRGEFIPVLYLSKIFTIADSIDNPMKGLVVLVENGRSKFGLITQHMPPHFTGTFAARLNENSAVHDRKQKISRK